MPDERKNILKNVLLCVKENKLQFCDILFDSKIREIIPISEQIFDWKDVKNKTHRDRFLGSFSQLENIDGANIIDGKFLLAIPGAIDSHVHFDTPGFEFREDFEHGSLAAAHGGVTTVIDMPCTSLPPVTTLANLHTKLDAIKNRSHVDYALWGGIAGNDFEKEDERSRNIVDLSNEGVVGFKSYTISGMETFSDLTFDQMKLAAELVGKTGKPLAVHAEDKEMILSRMKNFSIMEMNSWKTYCHARDEHAEAVAINKLISIAEKVDCKIHVVHLSSKLGLKSIYKAQDLGLFFTTETCPHYLYFTQKDFENDSIRNFLKTAPPVKFEEDKEALWKGLEDGSILFVTTDHAGCDPEKEKSSDNFSEVYGGIPGVEHRVPFLFTEGFLKDRLTLERTIHLLSTNAADHFKLKSKGHIEENFDADISLIDLWDSEIISASNMHSKGKYTPFEGVRFNAMVEKTFLRGNLIMSKEEKIDKLFSGRFISVKE